jgi:phenylacetate-coenzyme A ligase PaaK-like adenylate-forming protein
MTAIERLVEIDSLFDLTPDHEACFVEAMRDASAWHFEHSPVFRNLALKQGFRPDALTAIAHVADVPHVFVNAFKQYEILSVPREEVVLTLTSSGTSGQRSQIMFDQPSLDRGLRMVDRVFEAMGLKRPEQVVNYILFAYDPEEAKQVGTSYTDDNLTNLTRKGKVYHALRWNPDKREFEFRPAECYAKLLEYAADGLPVRLLGFPAFLHRLVQYHRESGAPPLNLGAESYVLTGGGWKTSEHAAIDKDRFIEEVSQTLGIPAGNLRDGYGLVEHGIAYIECEHHRFHVPAFARAFARDVGTLEVLPDGEAGFLQLVTPYMRSMPTISLLTSDLAKVGRDCPCGRNSGTIVLQGRAGTRKNKGCAITAAQLLK